MSNEGLPSLEDLFDQNFGDGLNDDPDGEFEDDSLDTSMPIEPQSDEVSEGEEEQLDSDSDVPAKLSDLLKENSTSEEDTQSDEDGQGEAPVDLAQEITLPNGEKTTMQELVNRGLMRADYTRKTQELADERRAFEEEKAALEAARDIRNMLTEDPVGTIAEMALRAGIIDEAQARQVLGRETKVSVEDVLPGDKKSQEDIETLIAEQVEARVKEILEDDPARKQYQVQESQAKVQRVFESIEQTYGTELDDEDRNTVLQVALEMNEPNLEYVYLRLNEELRKAQNSSRRVKSGAAKKSVRGVQPTDADIQTEPPKTLEDAWRQVEARLGA